MQTSFKYSYSVEPVERFWQYLFSSNRPKRYLEVGSFEGLSSCRALSLMQRLEYATYTDCNLTCIDTWRGGEEHASDIDFVHIEEVFNANIGALLGSFNEGNRPSVEKHKGPSFDVLCKLNASSVPRYDFVYIDGSHTAWDTLADLILSWNLLAHGGVMVIDDYLWKNQDYKSILHEPKLAIDAFTTIYNNQLKFFGDSPLRQVYLAKS